MRPGIGWHRYAAKYSSTVVTTHDYTAPAPGIGTIIGGQTLTQASGVSVQVTAGTGTPIASTTTNNSAAYYYDGTRAGLQFEEAGTNVVPRNATLFSSGGSGFTGTLVTGADGTASGAARVQVTSGGYSNYLSAYAVGAGSTWVLSQWVTQSAGGAASWAMSQHSSGTVGQGASGTTSANWARQTAVCTYASAVNTNVVPGEAEAGQSYPGGPAAGARDFIGDFCQFENSKYVTSAMIGGARAACRLQKPASAAVSKGRIELYRKCYPLGALSQYPSNPRIFTFGTFYAEINASTGVITVTDGSTTVATSAISFNALDTVEITVKAGGFSATVVTVVVNGTTTLNLTTGAPLSIMPSTGSIDVGSNGTSQTFSAIVAKDTWTTYTAPTTLLSAIWTSITAGAYASLPDTSTNASSAPSASGQLTVRTSASAYTTCSAAQARIYNDGTVAGLINDPSYSNVLADARVTGGSWTAGAATQTNAQAGPTGTLASRITATSVQNGPTAAPTLVNAVRYTMSRWAKAATGGTTISAGSNRPSALYTWSSGLAPSAWARLDDTPITSGAAAAATIIALAGSDESASTTNGPTAAARDVTLDVHQLANVDGVAEMIITSGGASSFGGDLISRPASSMSVSSGRAYVQWQVIARQPSSAIAADVFLLYVSASTYVKINSTGNLVISVGGTSWTSTNTIPVWRTGDPLTISVALGNSIAGGWISVGGAAATVFTGPSPSSMPSLTAAAWYLGSNGTGNQFPALYQSETWFDSVPTPTGSGVAAVQSNMSDSTYWSPQTYGAYTAPMARYRIAANGNTLLSVDCISQSATFPYLVGMPVFADGVYVGQLTPLSATVPQTCTIRVPPGTVEINIWSAGALNPGSTSTSRVVSLNSPGMTWLGKQTPSKRIVVYGDSITSGAWSILGQNASDLASDPAYRYLDACGPAVSWFGLTRRAYGGGMTNESYSGRQLYNDYSADNTMTTLANTLVAEAQDVGAGNRIVMLFIGTNDYGNPVVGWRPSNFQAAYGALMDKIHAADSTIWIYCVAPTTRQTETANTNGDTLAQFRTAISTAQSTRTGFSTYYDASTIMSYSTANYSTDGIHPNYFGHALIASAIQTKLTTDGRF